MKRYLPLAILTLISIAANAQQLPLYTQYIFNPYMINPAMVASYGKTEVNALYRNQWTGIENGPKTLQFDVQLPVNDKMALGLNVGNDKTILLDATSVLLTYGYRVPIASEHTLAFGLSAGVFTNKVNLGGVPAGDANDPALASVKLNNTAVDGQFGITYSFRNFTAGVAAVNLFERKALSSQSFQDIKLSQLKNDIIFITYKADIIPDLISVRPSFSYRLYENAPSFYEASAVLSYKDLIDVGGGYRQSFGPSAMVRLNLGNFQAGFAYDFPSPTAQVSTGGTQEIQLKFRFGKVEKKTPISTTSQEEPVAEKPRSRKKEKQQSQEPDQNENRPAVKEEAPKNEPAAEQKQPEQKQPEQKQTVIETTPPVVEPPKQESVVVQRQEPVVEKKEPVVEPKQEPVSADYYLIINTFEDRANAEAFYNSVIQQGVKAEIKETKAGVTPHYFYVHLPEYRSKEISVDKVLEVQKKTGFKDAWYKKID